MSKLKEKLMLSEKGYSDLKKAITACTITNIALLLPSMVACLLFWELLKPFTGEAISWDALWKLLGLGVVAAILVFLAAKNDYRKTYIASYKEASTTRLRIAEHLRKLPMSFFNTKDLSDITTNMMADNSSMEFLPDLKLNDSTGKTIADRAEESLDKVFTAAAAGKSFSTIKNEFSADTAVQKTAKEQYQQLCDAYLNSDTNTGITSITVSSVSTTVTNESNQMKIETNVTAAIERRTRFLHFFRKTKIETVTWKLESVVTLENEKWVMGSDFLTKIGHEA